MFSHLFKEIFKEDASYEEKTKILRQTRPIYRTISPQGGFFCAFEVGFIERQVGASPHLVFSLLLSTAEAQTKFAFDWGGINRLFEGFREILQEESVTILLFFDDFYEVLSVKTNNISEKRQKVSSEIEISLSDSKGKGVFVVSPSLPTLGNQLVIERSRFIRFAKFVVDSYKNFIFFIPLFLGNTFRIAPLGESFGFFAPNSQQYLINFTHSEVEKLFFFLRNTEKEAQLSLEKGITFTIFKNQTASLKVGEKVVFDNIFTFEAGFNFCLQKTALIEPFFPFKSGKTKKKKNEK